MEVDYKVVDTKRIIDYIESFPEKANVSVEDIMKYSRAEKLRVYPILFELEQSGYLEVVEKESLGAPRIVHKVHVVPSPVLPADSVVRDALTKYGRVHSVNAT